MFMALCSTLLRTYTAEFPGDPARAFADVNRRILADTDAGQFVTVFYGVLDPATGQLAYCNAGQCPALHAGANRGPMELIRTGPPLGAFEEGTWYAERVILAEGDALVLYTDGSPKRSAARGSSTARIACVSACRRTWVSRPRRSATPSWPMWWPSLASRILPTTLRW